MTTSSSSSSLLLSQESTSLSYRLLTIRRQYKFFGFVILIILLLSFILENQLLQKLSLLSKEPTTDTQYVTIIPADDNDNTIIISEEIQPEQIPFRNDKQQQRYIQEHVHVLYGLSGNKKGFLHEFGVSLKSVLYNAPIHANLTIHIMADQLAYDCLYDLLINTTLLVGRSKSNHSIYNDTNNAYKNSRNSIKSTTDTSNQPSTLSVSPWKSMNPISIKTYNVASYIPEWIEFIEIVTNSSIYDQTYDHTIGTYFRLFAHHVLLNNDDNNNTSFDDINEHSNATNADNTTTTTKNISINTSDNMKHVLYLDTDVIVMANLDSIWKYTKTKLPVGHPPNHQEHNNSKYFYRFNDTYTNKSGDGDGHRRDDWIRPKQSNTIIDGTNRTISFNNKLQNYVRIVENNTYYNDNNYSSKNDDDDVLSKYDNDDDNEPLFMWGLDECAGFVILNLYKLDTIWNIISVLNVDTISYELNEWMNDQTIFRIINYTFPHKVGILPIEWDVSIAAKSKLWLGNLSERRRSGVGMLHFNGGGKSKESAYIKSDFIKLDKFKNTWGNARFYVTMPCNWIQFSIESRINQYDTSTATTATGTSASEDNDSTKDTDTHGVGGYPIQIFHKYWH